MGWSSWRRAPKDDMMQMGSLIATARVACVAALVATVAAVGASMAWGSQRNDGSTHALARSQFAESDSGRALLDYVVSCALPAGVQLESNGHRFDGSLGLAPTWLHEALAEHEQRLVSACLLARTNFFGLPVRISMRSAGDDAPAGLRADDDERARFARFEAGFFGNLFAVPAAAYVCAGDARADRSRWLQSLNRICSLAVDEDGTSGADASVGSPTVCGFTYVGLCSDQPFVQAEIDYSAAVIDVYLPAPSGSDARSTALPPQSAAPTCSACPLDDRARRSDQR